MRVIPAQQLWAAPRPLAKPTYPELDALRHRVNQWRDYNQTWLDTNLGGEAAQEYKSESQHPLCQAVVRHLPLINH